MGGRQRKLIPFSPNAHFDFDVNDESEFDRRLIYREITDNVDIQVPAFSCTKPNTGAALATTASIAIYQVPLPPIACSRLSP
jgi:hypothetical protein